MFISEDDPFYSSGFEQSYKINVINENSTSHSNNKSLDNHTFNIQPSFTDFTQIIAKCLYKGPYESNYILSNPFCPLCTKIVQNFELFTNCQVTDSRNYMVHDACLANNLEFQMTTVSGQQDEMKILQKYSQEKRLLKRKVERNLVLEYRQFLIEIFFFHPISQKKFCKIEKVQKLPRQHTKMQLQLQNSEIQNYFEANLYVLPLTDFIVKVKVTEVHQEETQARIHKYVNFKKLAKNSTSEITFGCKQIQFRFDLLFDLAEKQRLMDQMNYKIPYDHKTVPMLLLKGISVELPEQLQEEKESSQEDMESSCKLLQLLQIDKNPEQERSFASRKSTRSNFSFQTLGSRDTKEKYSKGGLEQSLQENTERQKVNLQKLIKTNTLKEYVRNNTQSRNFQAFLQKATFEEIDLVMCHLMADFPQLMKHEYGNYMMQKLFSVCGTQKRVEILGILVPSLTSIIMNKQGTHAFQDFLSFCTTEAEYSLILNNIRTNFFELCCHTNATHFVQKIIKVFPLVHLNEFFYYCAQNLYQFSCDRNGMCVIKQMIKKLKNLNDLYKLNTESLKQEYQLVEYYKKVFSQQTLYHLDALIGDMYGNYVVQFNFQLFEESHTHMLRDSVLMKLPQYSLSKYSTNVVFKCLNLYWCEQHQYVSNFLKEIFQPCLVLEMYKNKDGNKILLEIMQRYEGYEVWTKLYNILIQNEPTRFYHDRWGAVLGSRSGMVGGNWNSFSDAVKSSKHQKKNFQHY